MRRRPRGAGAGLSAARRSAPSGTRKNEANTPSAVPSSRPTTTSSGSGDEEARETTRARERRTALGSGEGGPPVDTVSGTGVAAPSRTGLDHDEGGHEGVREGAEQRRKRSGKRAGDVGRGGRRWPRRARRPAAAASVEQEHPSARPHREPRTEHDRPAREDERRRAATRPASRRHRKLATNSEPPSPKNPDRSARSAGAGHEEGTTTDRGRRRRLRPVYGEARRSAEPAGDGGAITGRRAPGRGHGGSGAAVVRPGRRTTMRHPVRRRGPASAWIDPPCRSTIQRRWRDRDRRRRVAGPGVVEAVEPLEHAERSSAGMPGPRSVTTSSTPSSPRLAPRRRPAHRRGSSGPRSRRGSPPPGGGARGRPIER